MVSAAPLTVRRAGSAVCALLSTGIHDAALGADDDESVDALTAYVGRISSVNAWHDLVTAPSDAEFVDAYLLAFARTHTVWRSRESHLSFEAEGQVAYNFGDQSHWEINVAAGPRWHRFPWNDVLATSAAFGLGLSLASELPPVEVALEGDSAKLLIYWHAELTLGPPRSPWALSLRLHHRSTGFGLFAEEGGMNALALGVRYGF